MLPQHGAGQTLQPTALVHEAYLRLVGHTRTSELARTHFFNLAAQAMRQVLADHARRRRAAKRGGDRQRVDFGQVVHGSASTGVDVVSLDDALTALAELDARQARIVELRFLAGMTIDETAVALGVSPRTVQLDWRMARAWLRRRLGEGESP
jgi:RNA polymerase sigma factor (TIGR02999 family)